MPTFEEMSKMSIEEFDALPEQPMRKRNYLSEKITALENLLRTTAELIADLEREARQNALWAEPGKSVIADWHVGQCAARREIAERLQKLLAEYDEVEPITSY